MKLRVAIIEGGRSGEHEVSLRSAAAVAAACDPGRYEVQRYRIGLDGRWSPRPILPEPGANPEIDVVFPVLHGTFGEDGTMQGLLELADLPYVGAGVLASAVAMDKDMMKRVCRDAGLPVVEWELATRAALDASRAVARFGFPLFVKPANLGSSVGISKARTPEELDAALRLAAQYDRKVIVERAIAGREFECSVLGNEHPEASVPSEILPSREFYDYDDKYLLNAARTLVPAPLDPAAAEELRRLAIAAYRAVECEGMARVDFFLEARTARFYLNEVNTIPGFTAISMYPKMWEHSGLLLPQLVDRLIELALDRHSEARKSRYAR
ncbi:MAG: D-alanine--D-alanine ligase [Bryobacterales bacterium]|nr:D-alanine--D-alanine ligase [Bryobacterales bacterium]